MKELKGSPSQGLFGATLGFFIGFAAVSLFGPTAGHFKTALELSPILVGLLVAMPSLSGSMLRIPFSAWVDTTGGRKPFLVLLALSISGMLGLVTVLQFPRLLGSLTYPALLMLGCLSGCGIATFSVGISQVSYWFPQSRQGRALGAFAGFGNVAPGLFSFLLPLALVELGLVGSYVAWLLFLAAGTLWYAFAGRNAWYFQLREQGLSALEAKQRAREMGQELFPQGSMSTTLKHSARVWKTWALVGIYFTTFGGFIALTAWFPTYWNSFFSTSAVTAGLLTALYSVLTSLIRVPGGLLADRLGGERTAIVALLTVLAGAVLMTLSRHLGLSIFSEVLLGLGMGVANAAVFKLVPQEVPEAVGGAAGWVGGLGAFGGFVVPPLMGSFVKWQGKTGYAAGFLVFIVLALLSLALAAALSLPPSRERSGEEPKALSLDFKRGRVGELLTLILVIALGFNLIILAFKLNSFHLPGNQQGYEPRQPIAFSHLLHAGELEISCLYCHSGAQKGRRAGIPPASLCMNCHQYVSAPIGSARAEEKEAAREGRRPRPVVSPEIEKLYRAQGLNDNLKAAANPEPIQWIRVHNLPDFVYFDHRAHVAAGVVCQTCHGPVQSMAHVHQVEDLSMGWCVNCHRQTKRTGVAGHPVKPSTDCSTCHY